MRRIMVLALVALVAAPLPSALASAPSNDDRFEAAALAFRTPAHLAPGSLGGPGAEVDRRTSPYRLLANVVQSTAGATMEDGEQTSCGDGGASVWFVVQATGVGLISVWTSGSSYDTIVALYEEGGGELACNDDDPAAAPSTTPDASRVVAPVRPGVTYLVQVAGRGGMVGTLKLEVTITGTSPNDDRADALRVALGTSVNLTAAPATLEAGEPGSCSPAAGSLAGTLWFTFAATTGGLLTIKSKVDGLAIDDASTLAVFHAGSTERLGCGWQKSSFGDVRLSVIVEPGRSYDVQVGTTAPTKVVGSDVIFSLGTPVRPANDDRANATNVLISDIVLRSSQSTIGATTEPTEPQPCASIGASVWFRFKAPANGTMTIAAVPAAPTFDAVLSAYESQSDLPLDCDDDGGGADATASRIAFAMEKDKWYDVQAAGSDGAAGEVLVEFSPPFVPPANDARLAGVPLALGSQASSRIRHATLDEGEASCAPIRASVWFRIEPAKTGSVTLNASLSSPGAFAVYPAGSQERVACAARTSGSPPWVSLHLPVLAGEAYELQVGIDADPASLVFFNLTTSGTPPHDARAAAADLPLRVGHVETVQLADASVDPGEAGCGFTPTRSAWYSIEATFTGPFILDATLDAAPSLQASLALYPTTAASPLLCGVPGPVGKATLKGHAAGGDRYHLQVATDGSRDGSLAPLTLRVGGRPVNDDLTGALEEPTLGGHFEQKTVTRSNLGTTLEAGEPRPCGPIGASAWHTFVAKEDRRVVLETEKPDSAKTLAFDTVLAVYRNGWTDVVACDDDAVGRASRVEFQAVAGVRYHVQVAGYEGGTGDYVLHYLPRPTNDDRSRAAPLLLGATTPALRYVGPTLEHGESMPCARPEGTVWFRFVAPADASGFVVLDTFREVDPVIDTALAVYPAGSSQALACDDDTPTPQFRQTLSLVSVPVVAGAAYDVQLGFWREAAGTVQLTASDVRPCSGPPNDCFASPAPLFMFGSAVGWTWAASQEPDEPSPCGGSASVWYAWTANATAPVTIDTFPGGFDTAARASMDADTVVAVYEGDALAELTHLACNDDAAPGARYSSLAFLAEAGKTYRVQVGGRGGEQGHHEIKVSWATL